MAVGFRLRNVWILHHLTGLTDLPFSEIFPTIDSLPASGLTPRLYDWSVSSEHLGFYGRPME